MAEAYISTRCKKMLFMMIATEDYVPLQQISEELKLSKRSIYYELCKINDWLTVQGIPEIEVVRGKGIKLSEEMKLTIEQAMAGGDSRESYIFSPMERIHFIICYIIKAREAVSVDKLCDYLQVSRNTIFNDIRVVVKQLQDYDLQLEYESKKGYHIKGDCIRIRALFILYLNKLRPLFDSGVLKHEMSEAVEECLAKLENIENELNTSYVEGTLFTLSSLLPIMNQGDELYFPNLKLDEVEATEEYKLIDKYFGELDYKEKIYLCLHLLGARVSMHPADVFEQHSVQSNYEMAKALVAEFEKVACVVFDEKEDLERAIYFHLNTSMYRLQYGIQVGNPMLEDIVREYPDLFEITKHVCYYLQQQIGLPISDGEVAYFTLHFGAHLRKDKKTNAKVRVLVVCSNGISAGNMIKHELLKMLPEIDVVGVVPMKEAVNVQNVCDIVVSTMKMNCLVPVIVVHPILTDFDRKIILNHSMLKNLHGNVDVEGLFERLKKLVPEDKHDDLKLEIVNYFEDNKNVVNTVVDKKRKGMVDMLPEENIYVANNPCGWEKAIIKSGMPLIENGAIEEGYIGNILEQIRLYGPYMFITKDVVLAHARPEGMVNKMGLTLSVFKHQVRFSEYHKAKVIITLAAKDQEEHLKILKDIMALFSVENMADKLLEFDNSKEILQFLKKFFAKTN